jgi:hypothetical protein
LALARMHRLAVAAETIAVVATKVDCYSTVRRRPEKDYDTCREVIVVEECC